MPRMDDGIARTDPIRAAKVVTLLDGFLSHELSAGDRTLPKYMQLRNALVRAIEKGVVVAGDKLPSEAELTSISPYSLGTVQKALKSLMDVGLVKRKTGVGTIVHQRDRSMRQPLHTRFSKAGGPFLPIYPTLIGRYRIEEHGPWTLALGPAANIVRLDRRIAVGDAFSIVTHFYTDADKYPFFLERSAEDLNAENFKWMVQEETNRRVTRFDHKIAFATAPDSIAAEIAVPPDSLVMKIKTTARDQSDDVVYYQVFFIPPNDLDLTIESIV